ncbi:hypothetical protein TIFTF001_032755 [Ficus carica]|uniref:Uncharacterized protein n=1 Tax=Ficus carica TaxID=3494 RepID=A0AA88DZ48_FICCA|nr:hypothetical protein TIFTF001_032755 [Ficus carica]
MGIFCTAAMDQLDRDDLFRLQSDNPDYAAIKGDSNHDNEFNKVPMDKDYSEEDAD